VKGYGLRENSGQVDLGKMRSAGAVAQCFAIFLPMGETAAADAITLGPYALFQEIYRLYERELSENSDLILPARSCAGIRANCGAGRMSAILTVEDMALIEEKADRIAELYDKGVRMASLTWNTENCMGYPQSADHAENGRGLKPFGAETVERMNHLGMIVDVSHLSEGGFFDVAELAGLSKTPFVASHSGARSICPHPRNLTDEQLAAIGNSGGVVGVNFNAPFLRDGGEVSFITDIVRHLKHMADKAGIEALALGSDFDGITPAEEMRDYRDYGRLLQSLTQAFTGEEIGKICSENYLRVMKDCVDNRSGKN
jgi:membrane dipeptidase